MDKAKLRQLRKAKQRLRKEGINQTKELFGPLVLFTPIVIKQLCSKYGLTKTELKTLIAVYISQDNEQRTDTNRILSIVYRGHRQNLSKTLRILEAKRFIIKIANKNPNRRRGNTYTCTGQTPYLLKEFTRLMNEQTSKLDAFNTPL